MMRIISKICLEIGDEDGATAIEYGLIAALVSVAIALTVYGFGDALYNLFYVDLVRVMSSVTA